MFNNSNKTILVTGCAGFIGSKQEIYKISKKQKKTQDINSLKAISVTVN